MWFGNEPAGKKGLIYMHEIKLKSKKQMFIKKQCPASLFWRGNEGEAYED